MVDYGFAFMCVNSYTSAEHSVLGFVFIYICKFIYLSRASGLASLWARGGGGGGGEVGGW